MDNQFLAGLEPEQRRAVLLRTTRRRYRKGDTIFHEGDPGSTLHLLSKGFVAIRITTPMGDAVTLTVLGPNDFFGEQALLSPDSVRTASAVAIDDVETITLGYQHFEELRRSDPRVDQLLVAVLAAQVRRLSSRLLEALYSSADTRVSRRLHELADLFEGGAKGKGVTVPVTQADLASMAGTTRPTTNRVLQELVAAGVVELSRGQIVVIDQAALARSAR